MCKPSPWKVLFRLLLPKTHRLEMKEGCKDATQQQLCALKRQTERNTWCSLSTFSIIAALSLLSHSTFTVGCFPLSLFQIINPLSLLHSLSLILSLSFALFDGPLWGKLWFWSSVTDPVFGSCGINEGQLSITTEQSWQQRGETDRESERGDRAEV